MIEQRREERKEVVKKAEVGSVKDAANRVFTVDTKADGDLKKKKVAPVSTCSSAANLRPTLPVRTIALVSAQSGKLPFQFSASYKVRVWESLSLSHFTALYCFF